MGGNVSGGIGWVMVVNLIIWTGIFLYLLRLDRRQRDVARLEPPEPQGTSWEPKREDGR